jgi:hypothetical protein
MKTTMLRAILVSCALLALEVSRVAPTPGLWEVWTA